MLCVASAVALAEQPNQAATSKALGSREIALPPNPTTYFDLLKMSPDEIAGVDVARMNLLLAKSLPGSEDLDIEACLQLIDEMAVYVADRTEQLRPKFEANPEKFRNSEAFFKMTVMVTVLQKEKRFRYDPKFAIKPGQGYDKAAQAEMVKSSKHVFLNGLLSDDDNRLGTCSSMPVLWAAVGRRLGYPIKLAHAKLHLFARWDDGTERFNIEATEGIMASPPDEEYKKWPFPLTDWQTETGPYLKNLTPVEELCDFLNARFWTLMSLRRYDEALGVVIAIRKRLPDATKYLALVEAAAPLLPPDPYLPALPRDPSPGIPVPGVDNPSAEALPYSMTPAMNPYRMLPPSVVDVLPPEVKAQMNLNR